MISVMNGAGFAIAATVAGLVRIRRRLPERVLQGLDSVAQRLTVRLTPPAGTDRAALIWTRQPGTLTPAEWRERIEAGRMTAVEATRATRGMDFVLHEAEARPTGEWTAEVVSITHEA